MSESINQDLLTRARSGDKEALGELLRGQNRLLEQMARHEVEGRLQARLSAADIVQQTCLSAIRNFADFQGRMSLSLPRGCVKCMNAMSKMSFADTCTRRSERFPDRSRSKKACHNRRYRPGRAATRCLRNHRTITCGVEFTAGHSGRGRGRASASSGATFPERDC